jgi:hypothetical protein
MAHTTTCPISGRTATDDVIISTAGGFWNIAVLDLFRSVTHRRSWTHLDLAIFWAGQYLSRELVC